MVLWLKPGVRATPDEESEYRRKLRARAARNRAAEEAGMAEARRGWARGMVRPWYISLALDARALEGPEVDLACGVEEPVVDLWEAGEIYPSFDQLCALAKLTEFQRQAVQLAYYGGYSHSEMAERLGVPIGTVKTRLRDGMIRLRDEMGVTS